MIDEANLSSSTRALMRAAKADGPSAAARAKIWSGVAGTTVAAGAAGLASGPSLATGAASASGKLMAVGALFGSAVTVGLAMMMVHLVPASPSPVARANSHESPVSFADPAVPTDRPLPAVEPLARSVEAESAKDVPLPSPAPPKAPPVASTRIAPEDPLLRESQLVAEARSALVRGDALAALTSVHAARRLSSRALEPEELSIESHALRSLGREDEAMAVDLTLRSRFPEHALAR